MTREFCGLIAWLGPFVFWCASGVPGVLLDPPLPTKVFTGSRYQVMRVIHEWIALRLTYNKCLQRTDWESKFPKSPWRKTVSYHEWHTVQAIFKTDSHSYGMLKLEPIYVFDIHICKRCVAYKASFPIERQNVPTDYLVSWPSIQHHVKWGHCLVCRAHRWH